MRRAFPVGAARAWDMRVAVCGTRPNRAICPMQFFPFNKWLQSRSHTEGRRTASVPLALESAARWLDQLAAAASSSGVLHVSARA